MNARVVIPGCVNYYDGFIGVNKSARLLRGLLEGADWTDDSIRMFGKVTPVPRRVAWHGEPGRTYRYSGLTKVARGWTPELLEVGNMLRQLFPLIPPFDAVLLNHYRSGTDSIGRHSDDESDLAYGAPIVCVSLGVSRVLTFRRRYNPDARRDHSERIDLPLRDGSALTMFGACQREWTHEIAKTSDHGQGDRVSLTFRLMA